MHVQSWLLVTRTACLTSQHIGRTKLRGGEYKSVAATYISRPSPTKIAAKNSRKISRRLDEKGVLSEHTMLMLAIVSSCFSAQQTAVVCWSQPASWSCSSQSLLVQRFDIAYRLFSYLKSSCYNLSLTRFVRSFLHKYSVPVRGIKR